MKNIIDFDLLDSVLVSEINVLNEIEKDVYLYARDLFADFLCGLYHPDLYILPISIEGETYRDFLYDEYDIARYGAYEINIKHNGVDYLCIIVNND